MALHSCMLDFRVGLHDWIRGKLHMAQQALEGGDTAAAAWELAMMQDRMDGVVAK